MPSPYHPHCTLAFKDLGKEGFEIGAKYLDDTSLALKAKVDQGPVKEKVVTQEMRQAAFDSQETTDDHGMQIFGIVKDQNGTKYYLVKNSWGEAGKYKGIWYVSENFVKYKTMNIVVNKNAVPKEILKKLNIK